MKKKLLSILLMATMVATMLVGCDGTTNTNNTSTNETQEDTQVSESETQEDTQTSENETQEDTQVAYSDLLEFTCENESGANLLMYMYILEVDNSMCYAETNVTLPQGNKMNFSWSGLSNIGTSFKDSPNSNLVELANEDRTYRLRAWSGTRISEEAFQDRLENNTIEVWTKGNDSARPEEYYFISDDNDRIDVIFAVEYDDQGKTYKGYSRYVTEYIDDGLPVFYQWSYVEESSVYNQERTLQTINSLKIMKEI